jgi:hypothetical protein
MFLTALRKLVPNFPILTEVVKDTSGELFFALCRRSVATMDSDAAGRQLPLGPPDYWYEGLYRNVRNHHQT